MYSGVLRYLKKQQVFLLLFVSELLKYGKGLWEIKVMMP